jgi:hypothetical protein
MFANNEVKTCSEVLSVIKAKAFDQGCLPTGGVLTVAHPGKKLSTFHGTQTLIPYSQDHASGVYCEPH